MADARAISDAAGEVIDNNDEVIDSVDDDDDDDEEFEFPFLTDGGPAVTADDIFADGRILPVYPIFDRSLLIDSAAAETSAAEEVSVSAPEPSRRALGRLFLEDRNSSVGSSSSSSGAASDLEGVPPESYCIWKPGASPASPSAAPRKSSSTGSLVRWRRISDLVVGRSHSDGKEKFLFLAPPPAPPSNPSPGAADEQRHRSKQPPPPPSKPPKQKASKDAAAAHRAFYSGNGSGAGAGRRTYLPYRPELVGLFASVSGIHRSPHSL